MYFLLYDSIQLTKINPDQLIIQRQRSYSLGYSYANFSHLKQYVKTPNEKINFNISIQYRMSQEPKGKIYFERQDFYSLLCGMHSVNNILGKQAQNKASMNEICYGLSDDTFNPHKHIFGGDYDVNVLILALQKQKCTIKWYDRRNAQFTIRQSSQQKQQLVGFLINKYTGSGLANLILRTSPRHWFCVKRINNLYYFLDSKQQAYQSVDMAEAQKRIGQLLRAGNQGDEHNEVIEVYGKIE